MVKMNIPKIEFKQFSVRQIKIIIVAVAIVVTFIIIWMYIYIPVKSDFKKISKELVTVNERIRKVEGYIPQGETTQEQIAKLKEDFDLLSQKVPEEEGESLKMLMDFIRALNIQVDSTKSSNRKLLLDERNAKMVIDNKSVEMLLISIKLRSTYKQLVELIAMLRKSIPAYMSVQRLVIDASKDGSDKLDATLDLNLYLLTKNDK